MTLLLLILFYGMEKRRVPDPYPDPLYFIKRIKEMLDYILLYKILWFITFLTTYCYGHKNVPVGPDPAGSAMNWSSGSERNTYGSETL